MALFNKKPQNDDLEEYRDITDDVIERDFVPYACHWDPHTIVTKNGELLQVIKITGFTHEQLESDDSDADLRTRLRQAITASIDSTHYAVWIHTIRRQKSLLTGGAYQRDFAGYLNRFWNERNDWDHQFTNEVYVTIVREGENAELLDPRVLVRGIFPSLDMQRREGNLRRSRDELNAVVEKMLPILQRYGAARLGLTRQENIYYSDPAGFLGKIITMLDLDFAVTDEDMSQALTDYDVTFGFNAMEVRMRANNRRRFGAILTIKEYRELPTVALEKLLYIPARFIISQCFDFVNAQRALSEFQYQRELFTMSKAGLLAEKTGLIDILASNRGKKTDFGLHQTTMFLLADSVQALERSVMQAATTLNTLGMVPIREDIKFEECYWAQLPANFEFVRRMKPINTARVGGFAHLSNYPAGHKDGNHWGPAVTTFHTASKTPYYFNFHSGDNGHTTLIGPFGTGKTVLMNFLLAQARKFDNKLFCFDKDRGSEIFLRSLGGAYYNPAPLASVPEYARVKLNPFRLSDTPQNRKFLQGWMMLLAGAKADEALGGLCENAIAQVMSMPEPDRSLAACIAVLTPHPAAEIFLPWLENGELAGWFSAEADTLDMSGKICGFEMGDVISHADAFLPVLFYLLHRVTLALDGTPAIVVMDEAWTLLNTRLFSGGRLKAWLDMLRTRGAMALLATENVEEAHNSEISTELMKHIATQIYLPDDNADASYASSFGLSEKEITYLTVMNTEDRHFLFKHESDVIVLELNLSGMADIISVLSANKDYLEAMEQAILMEGLAPGLWMPKFLELI